MALFGRKIYFAEDSVEIVRSMRRVVEGEQSSTDAVKAYHDHLQKTGVSPARTLEDDLQITDPVLLPEAH